MKLIWKPEVYLIAKQVIDDEPVWDFLANNDASLWTSDTEVSSQELVEIAGRVCYMSFEQPRPGGNKKYIQHILECGHGSVLEHAVFTLVIEGISRSLSHELVRHRAGFAYSQLSQRYVDESDVAFVVPPALMDEVKSRIDGRIAGSALAMSEDAGTHWLDAVERAKNEYRILSNHLFQKYEGIQDKTGRRKAAREAARSVLPNATETKIVVTANARAWRHFIEMRASAAADAEIRRLAIAILAVLGAAAPHIFGDYQGDGNGVTTPYRKV